MFIEIIKMLLILESQQFRSSKECADHCVLFSTPFNLVAATNVSEESTTSIFRLEEAVFSETSVSVHQTQWNVLGSFGMWRHVV